MNIERISYHKTFNLGNYSNEKIGIDIAVGEGENPIEVFAEAKRQVEKSHRFFVDQPGYEQAKNIVSNPDDFTGRDVKNAQEAIKAFEANYPEFLSAFIPASRQLTEPVNDDDDRSDELGF
jgi:hypothetical protein